MTFSICTAPSELLFLVGRDPKDDVPTVLSIFPPNSWIKRARQGFTPHSNLSPWEEAIAYVRGTSWPREALLYALVKIPPQQLGRLASKREPITDWQEVEDRAVRTICQKLSDHFLLPQLEYIQPGQLGDPNWESHYWITIRKDPSEPADSTAERIEEWMRQPAPAVAERELVPLGR